MAQPADVDALIEYDPGKMLFETNAAVKLFGDQVVESQPAPSPA